MITEIAIKDLVLLERNPRKITKEQLDKLCKSIESDPQFLFQRPVLVHKVNDKLEVYAGNQRVRAAKKLKWKTIPCSIEENLSPEIIKERIIKDNKTYGEFDFDMLANEWDTNLLLESGFTETEIPNFDIEDLGSTEEDNEVLEPAKDEDAITKLGDVYELDGCHIVICGDSTCPDGILPHLEKHQPILMVTDPPYGVEYDASWRNGHDLNLGKGFDGKQNRAIGKVKNDDRIDWSISYSLFSGSIAYIWHAGKYGSQVAKHIENCEFEIMYQIIWAKQHFVFGRGDYHWQHEPCWYAVRKGCNHNWKGDRKQTTLWEINNNNPFGSGSDKEEKTGHSTQKPIECMARPIRNHTDAGDYVYDPFLGSGTTLIAAEQLKRKCIGVELSPAYCDIIVNRWINWRKKHGLEHNFKRNGKQLQTLTNGKTSETS